MSTANLPNTLKTDQRPCPKCKQTRHRQSRVCRECYMKKCIKPRNYLERECKKCGKRFTVHVGLTKNGHGVYCSRSCARSGSPTRKRVRFVSECETCGKRFERRDSETKRSAKCVFFCSTDCWYAYNQRDNHYLWQGGQHERINPEGVKWRKAVLKRDKKRCRICNAAKRLEAHHILPFGSHKAERWEVGNGITLCHRCHVKIRHREMEFAGVLKMVISINLGV
jgi:hypothetical protein